MLCGIGVEMGNAIQVVKDKISHQQAWLKELEQKRKSHGVSE